MLPVANIWRLLHVNDVPTINFARSGRALLTSSVSETFTDITFHPWGVYDSSKEGVERQNITVLFFQDIERFFSC